MLNPAARRRQRWLLFAGRRSLHPGSRRLGLAIAGFALLGIGVLLAATVWALAHGAGRPAVWPLVAAGFPWSLLLAITSPAWGGFSFSATPDWVIVALFAGPALVNASIAGGLAARAADSRRRQRAATSASARS